MIVSYFVWAITFTSSLILQQFGILPLILNKSFPSVGSSNVSVRGSNIEHSAKTSKVDQAVAPRIQVESRKASNGAPSSKQVLNIVLFYQPLNTDSRTLFYKQLSPAIQKLGPYINLTMIPYGNTVAQPYSGDYKFFCEHGPMECRALSIHACAIHILSGKKRFLYIFCMIMDNWHPNEIAQQCAKKYEVDVEQVIKCANSNVVNVYIREFGELTQTAKLTKIPTLRVQGNDVEELSHSKTLLLYLCRLLESKEIPECDDVFAETLRSEL